METYQDEAVTNWSKGDFPLTLVYNGVILNTTKEVICYHPLRFKKLCFDQLVTAIPLPKVMIA